MNSWMQNVDFSVILSFIVFAFVLPWHMRFIKKVN